MSAIEIVNRLLSANNAVKAFTKKFYPIDAPQKQDAPYFVINIVGGHDEPTLLGAGQYYRHRVAVEAVAPTGTVAVEMGTAALVALRDVIKQTVVVGANRYIDVDILFANVDETACSPNRDLFVRLLHFNVRWRLQT